MTKVSLVVATATLFVTLAAAAQNLTKDEEGRQAVGMCYSGCMARYHDLTQAAVSASSITTSYAEPRCPPRCIVADEVASTLAR